MGGSEVPADFAGIVRHPPRCEWQKSDYVRRPNLSLRTAARSVGAPVYRYDDVYRGLGLPMVTKGPHMFMFDTIPNEVSAVNDAEKSVIGGAFVSFSKGGKS